jgi:acetyltransferase-like isoleucine patch superfamily enzyme
MILNHYKIKRIWRLTIREIYMKFLSPTYTNRNKYLRGFNIGGWTYGAPKVSFENSGSKLLIGKFCSIGKNVHFYLGGGHRTDWVTTYPFSEFYTSAKHYTGHPCSKGDIIVGNDVWIGNNATILSGVTIGDGAVIGAHALIAQNVRPYAIVIGNPGREIRRRFDDDIINDLLDIKWWNWPETEIVNAFPLLLSPNIKLFIDSYKNQNDLKTNLA